LSDLASSCEYLRVDKSCAIFSDDPKAKVCRQLKCENSQNIVSCCYLCIFRSKCATSCKYLGQSGSYTEQQYAAEDTCTNDVKDTQVDVAQFKSVTGAFCFSCNVEMMCAKTQFTVVDNWKDNMDSVLVSGNVLPVTVLVCPKCGKLEFKADIDAKR
jgi:hypothetical protein